MPLIFAHTGHVLIDLAVYLGPMVLIAAALKLSDRRRARRGRTGAQR
jgi:hypothetical protein